MIKQSINSKDLADLIQKSRNTVAFTGAGISTLAGIPDFRGPNGIYTTGQYDADKIFDIRYFHIDPMPFYKFSRDFMSILQKIRPTVTHRFLSALEKQGKLQGVITQNIDALHHLAGSQNIIEVHGSYWSARCISRGDFSHEGCTIKWWREMMEKSDDPPIVRCPNCSGIVKPNVVFFGEAVHGLIEAEEMAAGCDLMLVLGSTLTVYPAALIPQTVRGTVVVVNQGEAALEAGPGRYFIDGDLDAVFNDVAELLGIRSL